MLSLFKEFIWDYFWGKVLSVLGAIETLWAVAVLASPEATSIMPDVLRFDTRIWFGITILFLISLNILILRGANKYKKQLEAEESIDIVYNEKRYLPCRRLQKNEEVVRVGIRVIGSKAVENIEVFPSLLTHIKKPKNKLIKINKLALNPMFPNMLSKPINPGATPTCFVNIFRHKIDSPDISFCYESYPTELVHLSKGKYELDIRARGRHKQYGLETLLIKVDNKNSIRVRIKH